MRRLIVTEFLSLDGVMETPSWTAPYWSDEIAAFKAEETNPGDDLLLGRVTYEGFAAAWPGREGGGAEYFNGARKHVVSTTLDEVTWNNSRLIRGDVAEEVRRLKAQDGGALVVHGSGTLVRTLMRHGLVDLYRLLVYPVVLGGGRRLFDGGAEGALKLVGARTFASGVVGLIYEPDRGTTADPS